ncbi:conserved hypothetical protein [Cupriavidus taiwanensis]|nr:hypothetical protein A9P79_29560 [Cupriavidus taiwanensis]SOZ95811.1 conserved hypothetical protein [Cupriavidus taiwanensis]
MTGAHFVAIYNHHNGRQDFTMKFFEYLSTTQAQNRFLFYALIAWCILEAIMVVYRGWRAPKDAG